MPTKAGKLRKGDIIFHKKTGRYWRVIQRMGTGELYSVKLVPTNPKHWNAEDRARGYTLMLNAAYWLKHGWEVWDGL